MEKSTVSEGKLFQGLTTRRYCRYYCALFVEVYGVEVNTDVELESIPKHCLLPTEVQQLTQVCENCL